MSRELAGQSTSSLIELTQITRVYNMGDVQVHALRGVSLSIDEGEFTAVMGSSGSGKSTLMNIVGCLDTPSSGHYRLSGRDISHASRTDLAHLRNRTLGFVFQSFNLLSRTTAVENVELPLLYSGTNGKDRRRLSLEALEKVGLKGRENHHPNQMSGGQQQRVAIARALVSKPRVILADEPTGNLDSRTSIEVIALFQELNRAGITVLVVTHEPDIAAFASRVIVLKDGHLMSDKRQSPQVANPDEVPDPIAEVLA